MRKIFPLFFVAVLICTGTSAQEGLPAADFEKRIQASHPQLLDVRTAGEYRSGHLRNSLQADWLNKEQFIERVKYLDKNQPLLVYCASGMRSAQAAKWLLENGFTDVQNLKGGLTAWKLDGRTVEVIETTAQLSLEKYKEQVAAAGIVLVDFGAEWCPPCKKMEPVLRQLQAELPGTFILQKVDGGIDIDVMKAHKVDAIPTFIIYKKGKETWRKQGVVELAELKKQLTK
jgi:rhodanese-related sulfurtransferase